MDIFRGLADRRQQWLVALAFALAASLGCAQGDANLGAPAPDGGTHDVSMGETRGDGGDNGGDGSADSHPIFPDAPFDSRADTGRDASVDTTPTDGPVDSLVVDTTPVDIGADVVSCTAGASCPSGDPCRTASIECAAGAPFCKATGVVPNGTACGTGNVCKDGACVACAEGSACASTIVCHVGKIACATGAPVCVDGGHAPNGTGCGAGMVCDLGSCVACATGASCVPTNPCRVGRLDCSTGAPLCTDTGVSAPNGTTCGAGMVCTTGSCVACAAGSSCPASAPCKSATIGCSSGAPVCSDSGNAPDGTACGGGKACAAGTCICPGALRDCGGTCVDVASDPNNCGGCGTVCPGGGACSGGVCDPTTVTVYFPSAGDPSFTSGIGFWTSGDWVEGSRATTLPSASSATIHLALAGNSLTCDTQDMKMMINGVEVGRFFVSPGATAVDQTFSFPLLVGSTYTLRYETVRTVNLYCGEADLDTNASTVTLNK